MNWLRGAGRRRGELEKRRRRREIRTSSTAIRCRPAIGRVPALFNCECFIIIAWYINPTIFPKPKLLLSRPPRMNNSQKTTWTLAISVSSLSFLFKAAAGSSSTAIPFERRKKIKEKEKCIYIYT